MRRPFVVSVAVFAVSPWATPSLDQVTGVPGINDYTINGSIS